MVLRSLWFRHRPPAALPPSLPSLLGLALAAACAPVTTAVPAPGPGEIPGLEAELRRSPGDAATMVRLGAAYRAAGQPDRARPMLERAVEAAPTHAGAVLFLGLLYEDAGELARARDLYGSYLTLGAASPLRARIAGRLPLLEHREFEIAVREAVAQEARMVSAQPQPRTVAVFPFRFASQDTALEPLSRAMAELLTTDLSQTDRLAVLERTRVQILVDELRLEDQGLVDPASAARGGRLLGAERLVQGTVGGGSTEIQLDAAVVHPWTGAVAGNDPAAPAYVGTAAPGAVTRISESDAVQRLFDAEKRLALRIYEAVGIVLTAAEREAVSRRPTENLQAILAYGRGLRAADAGDFALAAQHFAEAARLDPGFAAARRRVEEAEEALAAGRETTFDLAFDAGFEARLPLAFDPLDVLVPGLRGRDPAQEVMGTEGYDSPTILEVIIRRPAGGQ